MNCLKKFEKTLSHINTPERARLYATSLLARREYSRKALLTRLIDKGVSEEIAETVLNELVAHGLQDDARFAESLVRVRVAQGKGLCVLRQEAKKHYLPIELLQNAIQAEALDWVALAAQAMYKRFGRLPETFKEKAQYYRFLMMRGFEREQIEEVLKGSHLV